MKWQLHLKCNTYDFQSLFAKKGYAYFTKGAYNLNIIGVRSENNNKVTNRFDDVLVLIYNTPTGETKRQIYTITTEPGSYYMTKTLGSSKGTAILVPNQYRGCWQIGYHKGKYKALCQSKSVKVYRDGNYDNIYDMNPEKIDSGIFGINIHRAEENRVRETIDSYSAGCQVFNSNLEFQSFMRFCEKQKELYGNSFTYTLIDEKDLV